MKKVSIIIPCYNQERYISDCLKSVSSQIYKNWECIIIDDGSTDESALIINKYLISDNRFKYLHQENQGVCAARNKAINYSTGEYILCLDADDKISPQYISLCVNELEKDKKVTLVTCNYQYFDKMHSKVYLEPYSIERLMGHNLFINCSMFRRNDFDRVNGFNENMKLGLEDWDFWLSILKHGGKVKYLKGIHFFYRIKSKKESRNISLAHKHHETLKKQIWLNHKDLYSTTYTSATYSSEYQSVVNSKEYKIGKIILYPFRLILNIYRNF